jgi:hypothetical protein
MDLHLRSSTLENLLNDSFPLKECNVSCTDMGLCGGTGPGKTKYVNVYHIQNVPGI